MGEPANVVCRLLTIALQAQDQVFGARTEKLCGVPQVNSCSAVSVQVVVGGYLVAKSCPTRDSMPAPVSMRFPRRGFWSGLLPSPGYLPYLGITLVSCIARQILYC